MNGKNDKVCGLIGMLIAGALLFASIDIGKIENQTIGADFVPKLVGVLLFVRGCQEFCVFRLTNRI